MSLFLGIKCDICGISIGISGLGEGTVFPYNAVQALDKYGWGYCANKAGQILHTCPACFRDLKDDRHIEPIGTIIDPTGKLVDMIFEKKDKKDEDPGTG